MSTELNSVRNLRLFNRLNKSIKQGITDLQNKDIESSNNYINFALKTAKSLEGIAQPPFKDHFTNIINGLGEYLESRSESTLVSTHPQSVHSQLWAVHKKICDTYDIPYTEDVEKMEEIVTQLADEGKIS